MKAFKKLFFPPWEVKPLRFEFRIIYMPSLSLNKTLKKRLENSSIFTYLFISKYLYRQNWSLHLCKVLKHKCSFISFCIKMHIRCHSTEGKQGFKVRSSFSDYIFVWLYICRYDMIWYENISHVNWQQGSAICSVSGDTKIYCLKIVK